MVGTVRIDPELQHAARAMERTRHTSFPGKLTNIAQIDKSNLAAARQSTRLVDTQCLDLRFSFSDELLDPEKLEAVQQAGLLDPIGDLLRHLVPFLPKRKTRS